MSNKKAKRKKKKQGIQQHKSLMERNKKEFCLKLVKIAKATGALDAFKKIPKKDIDFIYSVRIQSFRLEEAEKGTINKIELR
ncbi:MAG: hypothetical protein GY756_14515, partial [bacterium]|nr:hypothetical protein [bacterium]